jgi:antigen flippase
MSGESSYGQILRSSSIIGGAQAANYVIGLVRVKVVAMLLGPNGVGLISLYTSATSLLGTVSGLGVGSSGVREIVRAYAADDPAEAARTVTILRRACWATGLFGWLQALALAEPISIWMTGSAEHASAIRILGCTLLLGQISAGQLALLQGLRRIGDLARANVLSSLVGSLATIAIYFFLRETGVVPALVATAAAGLAVSFWFSKRAPVADPPAIAWTETTRGFRRLLGLGLAFMWSGALIAGVDMLTRSVIARDFGIDVAGVYQAAWALSGMFASFVLSAMGADFYPRLTALIHDKERAARAVNEQTEIGILLTLPGLLAIMTFSPLIVEILYTPQFAPAAELLPWMTLGVFGRVISWPLGFVQLALGASRWFAATETIFVCSQAALTLWWLHWFGPIGVAYAFAANYALYTVTMLWVAQKLIGFSWSTSVGRLVATASTFIGAALTARWMLVETALQFCGATILIIGAMFSLRGLAIRLGKERLLSKRLSSTPIGKLFIAQSVGGGDGS